MDTWIWIDIPPFKQSTEKGKDISEKREDVNGIWKSKLFFSVTSMLL